MSRWLIGLAIVALAAVLFILGWPYFVLILAALGFFGILVVGALIALAAATFLVSLILAPYYIIKKRSEKVSSMPMTLEQVKEASEKKEEEK